MAGPAAGGVLGGAALFFHLADVGLAVRADNADGAGLEAHGLVKFKVIGKVIENLGNDFPYGTFGFFNGDDSVQPFNSASAAGESGCRRARRVSR